MLGVKSQVKHCTIGSSTIGALVSVAGGAGCGWKPWKHCIGSLGQAGGIQADPQRRLVTTKHGQVDDMVLVFFFFHIISRSLQEVLNDATGKEMWLREVNK